MQSEIELQFHSLFGPPKRRPRQTRCATHELAQLCRELSENWDNLDEAFRQRVKQVLVVDEEKTPVRVALL